MASSSLARLLASTLTYLDRSISSIIGHDDLSLSIAYTANFEVCSIIEVVSRHTSQQTGTDASLAKTGQMEH